MYAIRSYYGIDGHAGFTDFLPLHIELDRFHIRVFDNVGNRGADLLELFAQTVDQALKPDLPAVVGVNLWRDVFECQHVA